ncbi:unnamed protein product [Adineta steineri]|uniref:Uncharacterized protein n=1 Tax=Adineta steineri TaxID=433720 RepID=A0A818ZKW4_9BILA|nr:unnamed protein product [Adineta steineri]
MIIFGLWAIRNIRSLRRGRIIPESSASKTIVDNNGICSTSSKDRQLALILIMDIISNEFVGTFINDEQQRT